MREYVSKTLPQVKLISVSISLLNVEQLFELQTKMYNVIIARHAC